MTVFHSLRRWRYYLHGEMFKVVSDQLTLKWLLSLKDPRKRLARWVLEVMDFDFEIEHRAGSKLVVPDTLRSDSIPKPLCERCRREMSEEQFEACLAEGDKGSEKAA